MWFKTYYFAPMKKYLLLAALVFSSMAYAQVKVLVPYRQGNLWGYSDTLAKIIVKPAYDSAGLFKDGYGEVFKGKKQGIINGKGLLIIKPGYDHVESFAGGYKVTNGSKSGYLSGTGKPLIPVLYDDLEQDGGFLILQKGTKYGVADVTGKIVLPVQYDEVITQFLSTKASSEQSYVVRKGKTYSLFSKKSYRLYPFDVNSLEEMGEVGEVTVEGIKEESYTESNKNGIVKRFGADEVIPLDFEESYGSSVFFLVKKNGKTGLVRNTDDAATPMVPIVYDQVTHIMNNRYYSFYKGDYLIGVSQNGLFGIINDKGETIVPFQYDHIREFKGYSVGFELEKAGKKGMFLPTTFYPIIEPKYDNITFVESMFVSSTWGFALYRVIKDGKMGYVGENGKEYFK